MSRRNVDRHDISINDWINLAITQGRVVICDESMADEVCHGRRAGD